MAASRRRGVAFWVGTGLVVAGLAMLGYVGWQFFGTNIVSERRQRDAVERLQRDWREPTVGQAVDAGNGSRDGTSGGTAEPVRLGDALALIRIPRFGDGYVMPVFQGVEDDVLARGFGHFEDAAGPGEKGNFALAAHRVTHGEPLRDMPSLRPGDEVLVETRDAVFTYELDTDPRDLVVAFRDTWVVDPRPQNPDPDGVRPPDQPRLITLTTCSELFHTDNRMIAFGHLVSTRAK
ncbi:class E sortase [Nocardioides mesophilus]|uniref:Class E sortase n=1 Tax=Nocardioides mesophilus TaxID=433659 RepID=A0A7G9RF24_9ACTN|nr:class E sortase [Nocardioides mesophilus]QNN54199.1 class E sortase [Nocardioides mesophilus]